jgi:tetratricopeptide (TPR) repeat protein
VAQSLNNLGLLYKIQGKYIEAESLYKRALAIWEKAFGPEDLNVATVLENMVELYKEIGKRDEGEKLEARARKIRSNLKRPHPQ